jgi:hypothetical protein
MLEDRLGNNREVDLFEALVSMNAGFDELTHLLEDKGGLEWQPLHGGLHPRNVCFAGCVSINQVLLLPCLSKPQGNL